MAKDTTMSSLSDFMDSTEPCVGFMRILLTAESCVYNHEGTDSWAWIITILRNSVSKSWPFFGVLCLMSIMLSDVSELWGFYWVMCRNQETSTDYRAYIMKIFLSPGSESSPEFYVWILTIVQKYFCLHHSDFRWLLPESGSWEFSPQVSQTMQRGERGHSTASN